MHLNKSQYKLIEKKCSCELAISSRDFEKKVFFFKKKKKPDKKYWKSRCNSTEAGVCGEGLWSFAFSTVWIDTTSVIQQKHD